MRPESLKVNAFCWCLHWALQVGFLANLVDTTPKLSVVAIVMYKAVF